MNAGQSRRGARVAVIGSDSDLQAVIVEVLEAAGYTTVVAPRTIAALEEVAAAHPALIVLDMGLGRTGPPTGWDVLGRVRDHRTLAMVPVLICTGDLAALRDRADQLGTDTMVAALPKPFAVDDLEQRVAMLLNAREIDPWDDAADLVLVADEESNLVDGSVAVLDLLGLTADDLRRRRVAEIVAHPAEWTAEEWRRYRDEGRWSGPVTLRATDGREIAAMATAEVVDAGGRRWHISRLAVAAA